MLKPLRTVAWLSVVISAMFVAGPIGFSGLAGAAGGASGLVPLALPTQTSQCFSAQGTPLYGTLCAVIIRPSSGSAGLTGALRLFNDGSMNCSASNVGNTNQTRTSQVANGANTKCAIAPQGANTTNCQIYDSENVGTCVWLETGNVAAAFVDGYQQRLAHEGQTIAPDNCDILYPDSYFGTSNVNDHVDQWWEALSPVNADIHDVVPGPNVTFVRRDCDSPRVTSLVLVDQLPASEGGPLLIRNFGDFYIAGCRDADGAFNSRCVTSGCRINGIACQNPTGEPVLKNTGQLSIEGMFIKLINGSQLAAAMTVNTTADAVDAAPGDGICQTSVRDECSLRAAIQEGNASLGSHTIGLPAGNFVLTIAGQSEDQSATGDLDINRGLSIVGSGAANTVIDGGGIDRVFDVRADTDFSAVTVRGGSNVTSGGGILANTGALSLHDVTIDGNSANNSGGGLAVNSSASLADVTVSNNSAANLGGGLYNSGVMSVSGGLIQRNSQTNIGGGAGVYNAGIALISNLTIEGNAALNFAGGIENDPGGTMTVSDSTVANNHGAFGGGIFNGGQFLGVRITIDSNYVNGFGGGGGVANEHLVEPSSFFELQDSSVTNNRSTAAGGGIYNEGVLRVSRSRIVGNFDQSIGGGIAIVDYPGSAVTITDSSVSENTGGVFGGGIYNNAQLAISGSTISDNSSSVGGGLFSDHSGGAQNFDLRNTTISGNTATQDGGGIYFRHSGSRSLNNVTIAFNTADSDNDGTGNGGGVFGGESPSPLDLSNSVISNNVDNGGEAPDCSAPASSHGYNLVLNAQGCIVTGDLTGNLVYVDPQLGPLADNGGTTATHALSSASVGVDAGSPDSCELTDQRGVPRPQGPTCDIGAFELALTASTPTTTETVAATPTNTMTVSPTPSATPTIMATMTATVGTWTITASMASARSAHTATLLVDGRVLVVGGFGGLNTAELFDPTTDSWTSAANLAVGRAYHRATLLQDGRVLVTGGTQDLINAIASAEIYDPLSNVWTTAGSMTNAVWVHSSTLLSTGQVLVTGGHNSAGSLTAAELYDPVANTWTTISSMAFAREGHSATVLSDGHVLIAGGHGGGVVDNYVGVAELFDPGTNGWSDAGTLLTARNQHSATLLNDGRVLVVGGFGSESGNFVTLNSSEVFDPVDHSWSSAASLPAPRATGQSSLLANGKVLFEGGTDLVGYGPQPDAYLYDAGNNTWLAADLMNDARVTHAATLLTDGRVLATGGGDVSHETASAELYGDVITAVGGISERPDVSTLPAVAHSHGGRNTLWGVGAALTFAGLALMAGWTLRRRLPAR